MSDCIIDHKMRLQMTIIEFLLDKNIIIADRYETGQNRLYLRADKDYGNERPLYLIENLTYDQMMDFLKRLEEFLKEKLE